MSLRVTVFSGPTINGRSMSGALALGSMRQATAIILMASVLGAIVGIAMKFSSGLREGGYVPFGPFLAGAGLTAMIFGPSAMLAFVGL
jgi:prepilin signal peptidase PulO-like enzyme (type II secretory pathway)